MYNICVRVSVIAVLLLAVTHQSHANSAAEAELLASANAILSNETLPQEYKVSVYIISWISVAFNAVICTTSR